MIHRAGIVEVAINTHHLSTVMLAVATAECERMNMTLTVSHEPIIQGTAGGIRGLRPFLQDDPFVVVNGDALFTVELGEVIAAHSTSKAVATMVLMPMPPGNNYAPVEQDPDGRIVRIAGRGQQKDGTSSWHFTGIHVINPELFNFISATGEEDINRAVYPKMISKGLAVRGYVTDAYWADIGNPSGYLAAQRDLLHGRVPVDRLGSSSPFFRMVRRGMNWIHATAQVGSAKIAGPAFFDAGSSVDTTAVIGEDVFVGAEAQIEGSARLNRAAVFEGTRIGESDDLAETIAWGDQRIPAPLEP
jgi:mannose-1-phosphate guanylyltransferase